MVPLCQRRIRELYNEYDRGTPQQYKGWWRTCFETDAFKDGFEKEVVERSVDWTVGLTEQNVSCFSCSLCVVGWVSSCGLFWALRWEVWLMGRSWLLDLWSLLGQSHSDLVDQAYDHDTSSSLFSLISFLF